MMSLPFLNILILNVFINSGTGMIIPVLPSYLKHDGFSTAGLTLPFVVLILGRFLSKYYAGQLIASWGDKKVLFVCFLLYASVFFLYPQLDSPWAFTLVRLFEGCVEGVGIICITDKAIVYSAQHRGKLMSYFGSSFGLGFILGPLFSGFMVSQYGIHSMFYSGALIGVVGAVMTLSFERAEFKKKATPSSTSKEKWKAYFPYLSSYLPSLLRRALFFSYIAHVDASHLLAAYALSEESDRMILLPIDHIFNIKPDLKQLRPSSRSPAYYYDYRGNIIWGLTASVLVHLKNVLFNTDDPIGFFCEIADAGEKKKEALSS